MKSVKDTNLEFSSRYDSTLPPFNDPRPGEANITPLVPEPSAEQVIEELNLNHALVLAGDKALVLREETTAHGDRGVRLLTVADMRTFFANRQVLVLTNGCRPKLISIVDLWLKSPKRRTYEGLAFSPSGAIPSGYYNLWQGYTVKPLEAPLLMCAMKCRRLLSHMKYNLCSGERKQFRYLLTWLADIFQNPDVKPGVALVLRGSRGVGKTKVTEPLRYLFGRHAIKVSQSRHLTGNFNRHLADKLLIVVEESFWSGNHAAVGPLQDLITSETLTVEPKGVDPFEIRSMCRLIMITNDEWAVPAAADERRYFVLDVCERRKLDHAYFAAIDCQMVSGDGLGYRALLGLLLGINISTVNLRAVPETDGLRNQRLHSLDDVHTFLFDSLVNQQLAGVDWVPDALVTKGDVYKAFIDHARCRGKTHLPGESIFGRAITQSFGLKTARGERPLRSRSWRLTRWDDAAHRFEQKHKVDVFSQCPDWKGSDT